MSYSYTASESNTFTIVHAKHIAAKVATDLKRMQRFYGEPSDRKIEEFETEIIQLLKCGYLNTVTYGFKKKGSWIEPTLRYSASDLDGAANDDPGRIRPGKNITDADFYSYLMYSPAWSNLTVEEKSIFKNSLPFYRGGADEPSINGYLDNDRIYSAGGKALSRASVRSY